jgi:hypothetical protein
MMDRQNTRNRSKSGQIFGALVVIKGQVTCAAFGAHPILLKRKNKKTIRSGCG